MNINHRNLVSSNVVDLLSVNDKSKQFCHHCSSCVIYNEILFLFEDAIFNAIDHRTLTKEKHSSEKSIQEKRSEKLI
jgi:hypothetical protein